MRLLGLLAVQDGMTLIVDQLQGREPAQTLLFTHAELRPIAVAARRQRGRSAPVACPDPIFITGYEDFLRALSTVLKQDWEAFRLLRYGDTIVLRHGAPDQRRQIVLRRQDVHNLLNQAFRQRRHSATPGVSSIPEAAAPHGGRTEEPTVSARAHESYEQALEGLGFHLDRTGASDILVADIADGFMIAFLSPQGGAQVVTTADHDQLARFNAQARRFHLPRRSPNRYRTKLKVVGRHLDARHASAALIQETTTGMLAGYLGPARVYDDDWGEKERLAAHLSDLLDEDITVEAW
jgi:hypothetical protein